MRILNRDISKVVLVDNAAYSYCFQVDNGIPILPYYEGSTDFELKALKDYLYRLK
jgi:CTD small phosphatase-like protein 2